MITVNLLFEPQYDDRYAPILQLRPLLADLSVKLLLQDATAAVDTAIIQSRMLRAMRARGDRRAQGPIIVNERVDQETVKPENRDLIREANTIGWIKECHIRDTRLHNAPHVLNYYHWSLLARDEIRFPAVMPEILLTDREIEKVALPFSVATYRHFDDIRVRDSTDMDLRPIDAFMFGSLYSDQELYRQQRLDGYRAMATLAERRPRLKTVASVGINLESSEVCDVMLRSKILVSNYGFSMSSYRDWQALYAGCVLIKPDTSLQVNYLPDLFKDNEWYVPCAVDYSDLPEKVDMVLSDYAHYYAKAQIGRAALFESLSLERRATDFYRMLMKALDRTPAGSVPRYAPIEPATYRRPPAPARALRGANLFAPSAGLENAGWETVRARWQAEAGRGPGGSVARKLVENSIGQTHDFRRYVAKPAETLPYVFSIFVKPDERSRIRVWLMSASQESGVEVFFDLAAGRAGKASAFGEEWLALGADVVSLEGGWWWCWLAARSDASDKIGVLVALADGDDAEYSGDGKSGCWFAAPRLEDGSLPTLSFG